MADYYTIEKDGEHTIEIKKSKFICHLYRIESEDHAKELIQRIKKEHWKANHNCSAFVLGKNQEIQRSSDDGEPSGTAGVPMLEVLKKHELQNVLAVVTRYFGGIKLGAGGLIRAYASSVAEGLKEIGMVQGILQQEVKLTIEYPLLGRLQNFLEQKNIFIKETTYLENITVTIMCDQLSLQDLTTEMIDLLNNQVTIELGEESYIEQRI